MLKHNVPLCSCGFFLLLENGMWSIPSNTTSPCHLPNSDCTLHVKTLAVWRGVFGWSPELWEVTLWLSVYVQNVNNLRAEQLSACTRFLFFFVFLQGVKLVRFEGCGVCAERVTQGEREAFSWTHFMDVLGSSDGNRGGQAAHSFLWGPCGVRAKNRRRRACNSTECLQPRLILTQVETSSATLLLLQVDSRPLTEASAPMRHPKGDKKKRNENYKLLPTLRLIFTNYTYSKSKC